MILWNSINRDCISCQGPTITCQDLLFPPSSCSPLILNRERLRPQARQRFDTIVHPLQLKLESLYLDLESSKQQVSTAISQLQQFDVQFPIFYDDVPYRQLLGALTVAVRKVEQVHASTREDHDGH